jgi:hypothetical protein
MPEGRSVEEQIALEKLMWETWPGYAAKVLWRAKVIEWLHRTQPDDKFISLLTRYSDGQASAIREFERASRLMLHENNEGDKVVGRLQPRQGGYGLRQMPVLYKRFERGEMYPCSGND